MDVLREQSMQVVTAARNRANFTFEIGLQPLASSARAAGQAAGTEWQRKRCARDSQPTEIYSVLSPIELSRKLAIKRAQSVSVSDSLRSIYGTIFLPRPDSAAVAAAAAAAAAATAANRRTSGRLSAGARARRNAVTHKCGHVEDLVQRFERFVSRDEGAPLSGKQYTSSLFPHSTVTLYRPPSPLVSLYCASINRSMANHRVVTAPSAPLGCSLLFRYNKDYESEVDRNFLTAETGTVSGAL
jgi:hypothetical protein